MPSALRGMQGAGRFLLGPRSKDGHEHEVGDDYEEPYLEHDTFFTKGA